MARPRVFLSSTFYDLRHIREDLDRFIYELGYEPVRHEAGGVAYGKEESPESYAYKEVELCDIIVTIIGGRFGTESQTELGYSITQNELNRALKKGIQVFIFIEQSVLSEFSTFQLNKESKDVKWRFVDDVRVYEFIDKLYQLPKNNPIAPFQTGKDITEYLRAQWAGLFQRFLEQQKRIAELEVMDEIKTVAGTLQQLVTFLTEERKNKDSAIQSILLNSHPVFRRFAQLTNTTYRVFFTTVGELNDWLKARSWEIVEEDSLDPGSVMEWVSKKHYIKLAEEIFDADGKLKPCSNEDWKDEWLTKQDLPQATKPAEDIPL